MLYLSWHRAAQVRGGTEVGGGVTPELRTLLRQAIDDEKRRRLFTTNSRGHQVLRREHRGDIPDQIMHGTAWGYRGHGCRCEPCSAAHAAEQKPYRDARKAAA